MIYTILGLLMCLFISPSAVDAKWSWGNGSKFVVEEGSTFNNAGNLTVNNGATIEYKGTIQGNTIVFQDGVLVTGGVSGDVTGGFNSSTGIILDGDKHLEISSGTLQAGVVVSSTNNVISGRGLPGDTITLTDANSELGLKLQSELDQNIVLNGGKVTLFDDLLFTQGAFLSGAGTVNTNGRALSTGTQPLSYANDLSFLNTSHLHLGAPLTLTGGAAWTWNGTTTLHGNEFALSLPNGSFSIPKNSSLRLHDVHVAELGSTTLSFADTATLGGGDTASKLILSGVTMTLNGSLTYTDGDWVIDSDSTINLGANELHFNSNSHLTVDGATLYYTGDGFDLFTQNSDNITLVNNGSIKSLNSTNIVANPLHLTRDTQFSSHQDADTIRSMSFSFDDNASITADFTGHTLRYAESGSQMLVVGQPGVAGDAIYTNVVLEAFSPATATINTGSTLTFGNGTRVELAKDETATIDLVFAGSATLDADGHCVSLGDKKIIVKAGAILTIRNATLMGAKDGNIELQGTDSKVIFENVSLVQTGDTTFAQGSFEVIKKLTLSGGYSFGYTSDQQSSLASHATLSVLEGSFFQYAPTGGTTNRLVLTDATSQLALHDATLDVGAGGISLSSGKISCDGQSQLKSAASVIGGAISLDGATLAIRRGARCLLNSGYLLYNAGSVSCGSSDAQLAVASGATLTVGAAKTLSFTGTLERLSGGTLSGGDTASRISFVDGTFVNNGVAATLNAEYAPSSDTITLAGSENAAFKHGAGLSKVAVSGTGNTLYGSPDVQHDITLADSGSELRVGIQSELDKNIVLNGGTLTLLDDLLFVDGAFATGNGTLATNTRLLKTGRGALNATGNLALSSGTNIHLGGPVTLMGDWRSTGVVTVKADKEKFDISDGSLTVAPASTMTLNGLFLSQVDGDSFVMEATTSQLKWAGTTLQFADDYTFTQGNVHVTGDCMLLLATHKLTFGGSSTLTVDGATLWFDADGFDFYTANKDAISLVNGGQVKQMGSGSSTGLTVSDSMTLVGNYHVDTNNSLKVSFPTDGASITVDGTGHSVTFAHASADMAFIGTTANTGTVTFTNTVLDHFAPQYVSESSGSKVVFGTGSLLALGKDEGGTFDLTMQGSVTFDGKGYCLDMSDGVIRVPANTTVTLKNIQLQNMATGKIIMEANTSILVLQDVVIEQSGNMVWSQGRFEVAKEVVFMGGYEFTYSSDVISQIRANSVLHMMDNQVFVYTPASADKDRLHFPSSTSRLAFHNATLSIVDAVLEFTGGRIECEHACAISSEHSVVDQKHGFLMKHGTLALQRGAQVRVAHRTDASRAYLYYFDGDITFGSPDTRLIVTKSGGLSLEDGASPFPIISGTLERQGTGTLGAATSAERIHFENGSLIDDGTATSLSADFVPFNGSFLLEGASLTQQEKISFEQGAVNGDILVSGNANTLLGDPDLTSDIQLTNSDTVLNIGVHTELDHNIALNGGTLNLLSDLSFSDGSFVTGAGTINTNKRQLRAGHQALTLSNNLTCGSATNIVFNGPVTLSSTLTASGALSVQGDKNSLDLSSGTLSLVDNATISINDISLVNAKDASFNLQGSGSQIRLAGSTIHLSDDVSIETGSMYVTGDSTLILGTHTFTFGTNAALTVDGATLWVDADGFDFYTENKDKITLINDAHVKQIGSAQGRSGLHIEQSMNLVNDYSADANNRITVTFANENDTYVVEGTGHAIHFAHAGSTMMSIGDGSTAGTLKFQNIVLEDLSPAQVELKTGGALVYGDGTRISLGKDEGGTFGITTAGSVVLDGKGYCLDVNNGTISVGAGSTLTVKNVHLKNVKTGAFVLAAANSKVVFQNVTAEQSDTWQWQQGALDIEKSLELTGGKTFHFTSDALLSIRANSSLSLASQNAFKYEPSLGGLDRLVMAPTSLLKLYNAQLQVQSEGINLTSGQIIIDNNSSFVSYAADESGSIHLNGAAIAISQGSTCSLTSGHMRYSSGFIIGAREDSRFIVDTGASLHVAADTTMAVTGSFEKRTGATLSGDNAASRVRFFNGEVLFDGAHMVVAGDFDPTNTALLLEGDDSVLCKRGTIVPRIDVSGTGNTLEGLPILSHPITLADASTELSVGITNSLNQDIALNGGTVLLDDDLHLRGGIFFQGSGTIKGQQYRLFTGAETLTSSSNLAFSQTPHIILDGDLVLQAKWSFTGPAFLNGNAHVIDMSHVNAQFDPLAAGNAPLHITNASYIKGVRDKSFESSVADSELIISNSKLELDQDVTISSGTWYIDGNVRFIMHDKQFKFNDQGRIIVKPGATLEYTGERNFESDNSLTLTIQPGGRVVNLTTGSSGGSSTASSVVFDVSKNILLNLSIDTYNPIEVIGTGDLTFNMTGHEIGFKSSSTNNTLLTVPDNTSVTFENVQMNNLHSQAINLGTNSELVFGQGAHVVLESDQSLSGGVDYLFEGNATLDGQGRCLDLGDKSLLVRQRAVESGYEESVLTIKNVYLQGVQLSNIACQDNNCRIVFENATLQLSDDFAFSKGVFEVSKDLLLLGKKTFTYTSDEVSTLRSYSTLTLGSGSMFLYAPASGGKNGLVLTDATSQITLHDSTFVVANTGLHMTKGLIVIDAAGTLKSLASVSSGAFVLGDGLSAENNVTVRAVRGGHLKLVGGFIDINDAPILIPGAG